MAKKLGADVGIQVHRNDNEEVLTKNIEEALGSLPDITIDCSGFESTVKLGLAVSTWLHTFIMYCVILGSIQEQCPNITVMFPQLIQLEMRGNDL